MLPLNHDEVVEHFAHRLVYAIETGVSREACVVWHSWLAWVAVHATGDGGAAELHAQMRAALRLAGGELIAVGMSTDRSRPSRHDRLLASSA